MRYHGATAERGRRCDYTEDLLTHEGLDRMTSEHPTLAPVYDAVRKRLQRERKRPNGGQLRNPDVRNPDWRWKR